MKSHHTAVHFYSVLLAVTNLAIPNTENLDHELTKLRIKVFSFRWSNIYFKAICLLAGDLTEWGSGNFSSFADVVVQIYSWFKFAWSWKFHRFYGLWIYFIVFVCMISWWYDIIRAINILLLINTLTLSQFIKIMDFAVSQRLLIFCCWWWWW